jgi:hypothetical protein
LTAVSLRSAGLQRMRAGFTALCPAFLDAGRALYAMLSGFVLFVAGAALTPWMWIGRLVTKSAPVKARETRWKRFANACRRIGEAVLEWTVFSLVAGLVIVGLVLALDNMNTPLRDALTNATNIIYPIIFFLALGVLYLAGWLALRPGAALLAHLSRRLTRQGLYALAVFAVVILAGATGAILYAILKPAPLIALVAGVTLLAGVAGVAIVSFGPSGIAIFNVGRWGHAPAGPAGRRLHAQARSIKRSSTQSARVARQSAISGPGQEAVPLTMRTDSNAAPTGAAHLGEDRRKRIGKPWSMPPLSVDPTGVLLVLAVVVAILLAWGGGELLLRAAPGTIEPFVAPVGPAGSPSTPRDNAAPGTGSVEVIQLGADGESADVSWRSGYRQLTARFDDGRVVQQLSLPTTACRAAAIVAFGAASSDGSVARNDLLAKRRAHWLADWAAKRLSQCPNGAPVVIAASLGQARQGLPLPVQRAVRLLALQDRDMSNLSTSSDPQKLLNMARDAFGGLDDFASISACTFVSPQGELPRQGSPSACTTNGQ